MTKFKHFLSLFTGVRALLIDKDKSPNWNPETLDEVSDELVDKCFERLPNSEELDI